MSVLALVGVAQAQPFEVSWWTIDGGGGVSSGGVYSVSGTIGQPDAGSAMTGGTFSVSGGFWVGTGSTPPCLADFDGDGFVDFFDFDAYVACFEGTVCPPGKTADFDGDGFVDFFDFDAYLAAFEAGC
jgi:hypothetical protein